MRDAWRREPHERSPVCGERLVSTGERQPAQRASTVVEAVGGGPGLVESLGFIVVVVVVFARPGAVATALERA